jgi:hypothetical protein
MQKYLNKKFWIEIFLINETKININTIWKIKFGHYFAIIIAVNKFY